MQVRKKSSGPSSNILTGAHLRPLTMHRDERGVFTEMFRESWEMGIAPVQWNSVISEAGVLRGVHVHIRHADYLILLRGRASVGLRDLRRGSPTEGATSLIEMSGTNLTALIIPPGVAHGFYFHEASMHIYSVSEYWDTADELGCHWADPALGISWPMTSARISKRDAALPPLSLLIGLIPPYKLP